MQRKTVGGFNELFSFNIKNYIKGRAIYAAYISRLAKMRAGISTLEYARWIGREPDRKFVFEVYSNLKEVRDDIFADVSLTVSQRDKLMKIANGMLI